MEHHGALGVMRSLGRLGVRVYGVDADRSAVACRSRYCRGAFVWDIEAQPARASVDFLKAAARRIGGRPVLLATNDETALFVAENRCRLRAAFVFPDNPLALVRSLYNKREMYFLARRYGIPTAETSFPECRSDVVEFLKTAQFPVMLKASDNIAVSRRAGKKMVIARSPEDLLAHYDAMEDPSNPTMMLQEYIPGGDDSVWMFNGYFDERSQCLFGITGKKIHQTPVYTGMTALGICLPNPAVRDQTQRLVAATGYQGILDIGYRYDFRDGSYKLLDSNPRLGATFRLFVGSGGLDVVRAAYLDLTGQPVPDSRMVAGRKWLLEDADIVSSWNYFRDGTVAPRDWIRAYSGIREAAWFAADDLRPFASICRWTCAKVLRHAARRFRRPSPHHRRSADALGRSLHWK
jgi:predicted ATP-grasp superfamily ATP-dependent carboligase